MIEIILSIVIGTTAGIFIGLVPGIGTGSFILSVYPILLQLDLLSVFLFYISIIFTTQFYGSVTAILTGTAGEITSIPAVTNGHWLLKDGHGYNALLSSAFSSIIASIIALILINFFIWASPDVSFFLSSKIRFLIFLAIIFGLLITSKNYFIGLLSIILGLLFGTVGWNNLLQSRILTFGIPSLDVGLNFYTILFGGIIIPILYQNIKNKPKNLLVPYKVKTSWLSTFSWGACFRGSLIGFALGCVPGVSYLISSNIAETFEKYISKKNIAWNNLISAEGANNAGVISSLLPFLLFSIPIIPSEVIIMGLFESKGYNIFTKNILNEWLVYSPILLIILGIFNFFLSGYCYKVVTNYILKYLNQIYSFCLVICSILFFYISITEYNLLNDIILLGVILLIQYLTKMHFLNFVYAFFISSYFMAELSYIMQMYII